MEKVSIIIPNFNHNDVLENAIRSALVQDVDKEIIVVDDGSDNPPDEIMGKYDVIYIKHEKNRGLATARNTAIRNATGTWILPLDADDTLEPDCIEKLLHYNGDIIYGNMNYRGDIIMKPPVDIKMDDWGKNNQIYGSSLYRKSVWESVGGYWEEPREFYEDWDFWWRASRKGFSFTYADVLIYQYNGGNMCKRIEPRKDEVVDMIRQHVNAQE